jgi:hypothetical protein
MSQQLYDKRYIYFVPFGFELFYFGTSSPVTGPEGSRKLRFPDFMTTAQDGGKAAFTPRKNCWYLFLLEAESTPGP